MAAERSLPADEEEVLGRWPEPEDPNMQLLLRRWAEWRDGLHPPPRSRVDPAALKPGLPTIWIWRLSDDQATLTCTLAGEEVQAAWGRSIIGNDPLTLWGPQAGRVVRERLKRVALLPAVVHGRTAITPVSAGGAPLDAGKSAERLILPLANDRGQPFGVIGMTLYRYDRLAADSPAPAVLLKSWRYPCAALPQGLPPAPAS